MAFPRLARTLVGAEAGRGNAVIRLLTDENLDGRIVRGVKMHHPEIELLRVQETDAFEQEDDIVLAVAASEDLCC